MEIRSQNSRGSICRTVIDSVNMTFLVALGKHTIERTL